MTKKERVLKDIEDGIMEIEHAERDGIELQSAKDMIGELKAKHGGKRSGAGRPSKGKTIVYRLTPDEVEVLKQYRKNKSSVVRSLQKE